MTRFLLDTNHLGEALNRVSVVRDRIQQLSRKGLPIATSGPVLCELLVGVVLRADAQPTRRRLDHLLKIVRIWPLDLQIAERYSEVYHQMRKAGRALSQVDIMLAAMARNYDATLLTTDKDFEALSDIRTENWLPNPSA